MQELSGSIGLKSDGDFNDAAGLTSCLSNTMDKLGHLYFYTIAKSQTIDCLAVSKVSVILVNLMGQESNEKLQFSKFDYLVHD